MTDASRRELPGERLDRHWSEILQELRVAQTGVQILTGFLLTVPFQARFAELSDGQRLWFLAVVVLSCVTTVTMLSPVLLHRVLFRKGARESLVRVASVVLRVSFALLGVVVTGVMGLVVDIAGGPTVAVVAGLLVVLAALWVAMPVMVERRADRDEEGADDESDQAA